MCEKNCGLGRSWFVGKATLVSQNGMTKRDASVMATNVSPLLNNLEVNWGDRPTQKPVVINLYSRSMGGVDPADQLHEYYSIGHSCYKLYRYIFWFLIDVSICNAFVLCNYHRLSQGLDKVRQLKFRTSLAKQLIGGFSTSGVSVAQSSKRRKIETFLLEEGNGGQHFIDKITGRKRQCIQFKRVGTKTPKGYPIKSSFEWVQCSVVLCREVWFIDYHML